VRKLAGVLGFFVTAVFASLMFLISFVEHDSTVVFLVATVVVPIVATPFVVVAVWTTFYAPRVKRGRPLSKSVALLVNLPPRTVRIGAIGYVLLLVVVAALAGEVPQ